MIGPFDFDRVYQGDCRELLQLIPDGSIDLLCTDAPYGNDNTHVRSGNLNEGNKIAGDDEDEWMELMPEVFREAARVLNPKESAILCFGEGGGPKRISNRISDWMALYLEFDTTLVWNKANLGMGWRYRRSHEFIFVGHRKRSELKWHDTTGAVGTVITVPRLVNQGEEQHSTPKPIPLMDYLIGLHTKRGDVVLDPFAGGGATGVSCKKLGRRFVGFEINPKWVELSNRRLSAEREQLPLFA